MMGDMEVLERRVELTRKLREWWGTVSEEGRQKSRRDLAKRACRSEETVSFWLGEREEGRCVTANAMEAVSGYLKSKGVSVE